MSAPRRARSVLFLFSGLFRRLFAGHGQTLGIPGHSEKANLISRLGVYLCRKTTLPHNHARDSLPPSRIVPPSAEREALSWGLYSRKYGNMGA